MKTVRNFIFLGPKSLQMVTSAMKLKTLANKWDLIKLKRFCSVKTNIKRRPSEWEKIFASKATDKGLISKYRNSSWSSISKKTNNPVNKWAEGLNGHFSEEDICMVLKQKNNAQHHYLLEKSYQNCNEVSPHTSQNGHHPKVLPCIYLYLELKLRNMLIHFSEDYNRVKIRQ